MEIKIKPATFETSNQANYSQTFKTYTTMANSKKVFVNRTEVFNPRVVSVSSGKYGTYGQMNGMNCSDKKMAEHGYSIEVLSNEEIATIEAERNAIIQQRREKEVELKLQDRFNQVAKCLASKPVAIVANGGGNIDVPLVANLSDSDMNGAYSGAGKGTAYTRNSEVIAFHMGYQKPSNAPTDCEVHFVMLSGHQICF